MRISYVIRPGTVLLFVIATFGFACAQTAAEREREANERDLELRSLNLRMMSERAMRPARKEERAQQSFVQLQEDFTRLQVINLNLVKSISNKTLDLQFVSKLASEINRRAGRLRNNLALPEPDKPTLPATNEAVTNQLQLKKAMLRLGKLIYSFSHNPFFKEASVVETQVAKEARRDLEEIIELSKQIRTDIDRLKKLSEGKTDN